MNLTIMPVVGEPSFGIAAPFAVGLSLLVSVQAAGKFTGRSITYKFAVHEKAYQSVLMHACMLRQYNKTSISHRPDACH